MRIADLAYSVAAATPQEYLIEEITDPRLYQVEGDWEWENTMDGDYYELLEQDLADIVAWMLTLE